MTRIPFCTLVLGAATLAASLSATASSDELYYPASNCQPFNAAGWQGGGSSGFAFQSVNGGMFNFDVDDAEALVCPVPYFRDVAALKPVTVRVVIDDRHHHAAVNVFLCGRGTSGGKICNSADNFPSTYGPSTIELSIKPTVDTRFVWIEVVIPDRDDDGSRSDGTSGVLGYRVLHE